MATTTTEPRNLTYPIVKGIAYGMFAGGLGLSVTHIFDLFHSTLGASVVTAAAVPVFVDGLQLIGRLARSHKFDASTRKIGLWVQVLGALLSLIANVVAGHSAGDKIGGAIFVFGYIFMEWFADRLRPVATVVETAAAKRSAAAQKAAATRAANKAKAELKPATRKPRAVGTRKPKAITAAPTIPAAVIIGAEPAYI
jgi:hypothetical protein